MYIISVTVFKKTTRVKCSIKISNILFLCYLIKLYFEKKIRWVCLDELGR